MDKEEKHLFPTLPDYLAPGLMLVFVGINPGLYSARKGHYFARTTNRFWPAFSRSRLSARVREALGRDRLGPEADLALLEFGIGFTDVVKMASSKAADLKPSDFAEGAPSLRVRLETYQPVVACFHGITGFRAFAKYALNLQETNWPLGPQEPRVGGTRLFVVPNPSPANAHFRLEDQVYWYDRLADYLEALKQH